MCTKLTVFKIKSMKLKMLILIAEKIMKMTKSFRVKLILSDAKNDLLEKFMMVKKLNFT